MKKQIVVACLAVSGLAAAVFAADNAAAPAAAPTCGQMTSSQAVLPTKMAEVMTSVAESMDAHAAFIAAEKNKDSKAELDGLKKMAKQHRDLAALFTKAADTMKGAANWTAVPHDMT